VCNLTTTGIVPLVVGEKFGIPKSNIEITGIEILFRL